MTTTVPAASRPRVPQDPLYRTPDVAWPTLGLFVLAAAMWIGGAWAGITGAWPVAAAVALQTVATFIQFTVLHDGVHRSLIRGHRRANDFIAGVAGATLGLIGTCAAFRYVHFAHHRHTNEHGADPDLWSGDGPRWLMPLKWATADFYYTAVILRDWSKVPMRDRLQIVLYTGLLTAIYIGCWLVGWGMEATLFWLLPSRLAILWLAFAFNFLPHHPHDIEQRHNPYAATNVRRGGEPVMRWVFLYQNYHLVHHVFPSVPFYRYARIWFANRDEWRRKGAPEVRWNGLEVERL